MLKFPLKIASLIWPKRRWCQYSVATLLSVVTVICATLGVWADRAYRQRVAVEALRRRNVLVEYDFHQPRYVETALRARLRRLLGDDYVAHVVHADLGLRTERGYPEPDAGLFRTALRGQVIWIDPPEPEWADRWTAPEPYDVVLKPYLADFSVTEFHNPEPQHYYVTPLVDDDALRFVGRLRGLVRLELTLASIDDAGLAWLAGLSNLQELNLLGTRVTDASVAHLRSLRNLRSLNLDHTSVTGAGFAHLGALSKLENLDLSKTPFNDAGVSELRKLTSLRTLVLHGTQVEGTTLGDLGQLTDLTTIYLDRTAITDAAVYDLRHLSALKFLDIGSCPLLSSAGKLELHRALPKCAIHD